MVKRIVIKTLCIGGFVLTSGVLNTCATGETFAWEKSMTQRLESMADSLTANLHPWKVPDRIFRVENFGAVPGASVPNTAAIQKAIDRCSADGGGIVLFSDGDYVTGTIELKSNVMLKVDKGSRILGSTNLGDYPEKIESFKSIMREYYEFRQSLLYAEYVHHAGICGEGEIYFRGEKEHFSSPQTTGKITGRPLGIRLIGCRNVVFQDIFLRNSAAWMINAVVCENMIFDGITIENHANYNNDGLDPDGCRNVIVRNCYFNTEDDAMCLKGGSNRPSRNMLIENSTFVTTCNAFKIGTDTQGDFENIVVRNVVLGGIPDSLVSIAGHQSSTGITLATVDGGDVRNIHIHDIAIHRARCPIFLRIGNRFRLLPEWPNPGPGDLQNVVIENVTGAGNFRQGSFLSGIEEKKIQEIMIRNVNLRMEGISDSVFAGLPVDENEGGYPDAHQFSVNGLPAYGFYIRHAKEVRLQNIEIHPEPSDARPVVVSGGNTENVTAGGKPVPEQQLVDFSYNPQYISDVQVRQKGAGAAVMKYRVGSRVFSDRSVRILAVEEAFKNAEYIEWPNHLRSSTAEPLLAFQVEFPGTLYVAHDPVYRAPDWLARGFENRGETIQIAHWKFDLYQKKTGKSQRILLGGNHQGELPVKKGANYVVLFVPDP